MKIKESELKQIIQEELIRYKKIKSLEERKNYIQNKLNEMYDECGTTSESEMEEGLKDVLHKTGRFFGVGDPSQEEIQQMTSWIDTNPKAFRAREKYKHDSEKYGIPEEETKMLLAKFFASQGGPVGSGYNFNPDKKEYFRTSHTKSAPLHV
jgi:hypothetical protein